MAALTGNRDTAAATGATSITLPVAANARIYQGAIVVTNSSLYASPAALATGLCAIGRASAEANNTGGAAGAISIKVDRGMFWYANHGGDPVTLAALNNTCYLLDDQTVTRTSATNTRSPAGRVINVDATRGVLVEIGAPGLA